MSSASAPRLKVVAMPTGWLTVDRSSQVHGRYFGQSIRVPVWSTAIVGAQKKIVVDTGVHDPAWVSNFVCPCEQAPEERLERALKEYVGWSADDVDIVINTHLHYDHSGGNTLFRNAKFVIQAAEWEYAGHPLPTQATYYQEFLIGREPLAWFRWQFVHGIADIVPGVRVVPTPGHTPGHQSVAVDTEDGVVLVAGDCANCMENIVDLVPVGIVHETQAEFASLRRIRQIADFVIPGHDPNVVPGSAGIVLPRESRLPHVQP
jgi:glyoxylase-like metal-dependent hydrolase (beta-lactamase superfamily II)